MREGLIRNGPLPSLYRSPCGNYSYSGQISMHTGEQMRLSVRHILMYYHSRIVRSLSIGLSAGADFHVFYNSRYRPKGVPNGKRCDEPPNDLSSRLNQRRSGAPREH
jgi:hypothetical protein